MSKNKYGLGREIPASIKREVRKRDGSCQDPDRQPLQLQQFAYQSL